MASRAVFVIDKKTYRNSCLNDIDQNFKYASTYPFEDDQKISALNSSTILVDTSLFVNKDHRAHLFYRQSKPKLISFRRTYIIYRGRIEFDNIDERNHNLSMSINTTYRKFRISFHELIRDVRRDDPNSEVFFIAYTDKLLKFERNFVEKIYDQNVRIAQINCSLEDMIDDIRAFAHMRMNLREFSYKAVTQVARNQTVLRIDQNAPQKYVASPGFSKWKFDGLGERSEIWQLDPLNFESKNRGSREDGLQQLRYARMIPSYAKAAETIIRYFSKCDPAPSVRRAAKQILETDLGFKVKLKSKLLSKRDAVELFELFVRIPKGIFLMGSCIDHDIHSLPAEEPLHSMHLDEFYIMKRTLSVNDWQKITLSDDIEYDKSNLPKTELNWFECQAVASFLEASFLHWGLITAEERVQLPSEAEWEKAARGQDGRLYPWGEGSAAQMCNCRESGFDRVLPSGSFSPRGDSPYGIQDMAGNVWQWTRSLWGETLRRPSYYYPYKLDDGREEKSASHAIRRVVRGGAFYYFDYCVRSSVRNAMFPSTRHTGGGVRFVISKRQSGK